MKCLKHSSHFNRPTPPARANFTSFIMQIAARKFKTLLKILYGYDLNIVKSYQI